MRFAERLAALRADRRVGAALCACVAVAAGIAWWRAGASSPPPSAHGSAAAVPTFGPSTTRAAARLVVHVAGAVQRPGIVRVAAGARVYDVIDAAGGALPGADLGALNLAAPVADGTRVAVPVAGQAIPPVAGDPTSPGSPASSPAGPGSSTAPVNLNTATAAELEALPGIGPATAAAIVADREAHGPFRTVDDLDRVRGIGAAKLDQLRDLVTV